MGEEQAISTAELLLYPLAGLVMAGVLYRWRDRAFRGVPTLSAEAMGAFRIVFGIALMYGMVFLLDLPQEPAPGNPAEEELWGTWGWVEYLGGHWNERDALWAATIVAIAAFTVGAFTRIAYLLVVAGFAVRLSVAQEYLAASHPWAPYLVVLAALAVVPWGDALSLDEWWRRRRGRPSARREPGRHYGLALWLPGLVLGVAWAAAAFAKLDRTGWEWVSGAAVKYHWAEDSMFAPIGLGAWLAQFEPLMVAASFAGVAIETLFITHVLFRSPRVRLLYGLIGAGLLGGFYLFQGLFWFPWWSLLLAFLPWEAIVARVRRPAPAQPPAAAWSPVRTRLVWGGAAAVAALVVTQQVAISVARVEQGPFFADYRMYSHSYASERAFNDDKRLRFSTFEFVPTEGGPPVARINARLESLGVERAVADAALWVANNAPNPLPETERERLALALEEYERRFGQPLGTVSVAVTERFFNWEQGELQAAKRTTAPAFDPALAAQEINVDVWAATDERWTVVMDEYALAQAAVDRVREYAPGGLGAVILDTRDRPPLDPGDHLVLSGSFPTRAEAEDHLRALREEGYVPKRVIEIPPPLEAPAT